ncbi:MAG: OmpA family protein, partial [Treponema sp.]|nr:OmpA family protein [Treponema sp.]
IFNGKSQGEVTGFTSVNSQANVKKLQETFKNYNLDNVNVSQGEKGLTLSIENIQFEPDSDKLLPSEQKKLQKIGEVLKQFNNDLLITGHCAERGTESARQALSESRAKSVADFLIKNNIRNEYHIFTQGKGSSQPVASNTTEEGRSRNRRVEITIMD